MRFVVATALLFSLCLGSSFADEAAKDHECALDFKVTSIEGKEVNLHDYEGKVVLIVNTASRCGLTPQYAGLQKLHTKHEKDGLVILGFPCNQFGSQEPGTVLEIQKFCSTKYDVSFPMFSKVEVNGEGAAPLYKYLTSQSVKPKGEGKVSWNFEKFLIGRDGNLVGRFEPRTKPDSAELTKAISAELKSKS